LCITGWLTESATDLYSALASARKPVKLAVIIDGLSQDFEAALKIVKSYKIGWVEIRVVSGAYNTGARREQIRRLKELLNAYEIRCSQTDAALFKCPLPGTKTLGAGTPAQPCSEQMELLKRAIERTHA